MDTKIILDGICGRYREILKDNFVGMYVHGSLAMDGFNPCKSDIDFIIVCEREPEGEVKRNIVDATIAYMAIAPAKGLEMHLMLREDCKSSSYPPRFVLHWSPAHVMNYLKDPVDYTGWMKGEDPDLAAHLNVVYQRGICWNGAPVRDIFAPVPREAYLKSILNDAEWSDDDAMYHVLNRCRTLGYLRTGSVMSKHEGAVWALENLGEKFRPVIREALDCYESDRDMPATADARAFCEEALAVLKSEMDK